MPQKLLDPDKASCIASAYERRAMNQGLNTNPVYPENQCEHQKSIQTRLKLLNGSETLDSQSSTPMESGKLSLIWSQDS